MSEQAADIGARLRVAREKRGLTLLQAAEKLHTDPQILESLEAGNFAALGAPVYARGHLRHYAEFVGESPEQLGELYGHAVGKAVQPDLTRIARAPSAEETNRLVAPALLVLSVFAVAGAVWWVLSLAKHKPRNDQAHIISSTPDGAANPADGSPDAAQAPADAPAASPANSSASPSGATTPAGNVPSASTPVPPPPVGSVAPGARLASAASAPAAESEGSAHSAAVSGGREGQVVLRYASDSWTEVYDASGARLFYDVGAADSVRTLNGALPLRIVLGNAAGVTVEVNGRATAASRWALPDGSAQLLINRAGHAVRAHSATDGG